MQRIDLNFATKHQPAGVAAWLLLLLGIAALAAVIAWDRLYWQPLVASGEKQLRASQSALQALQPAALKIDDSQLAAEWGRAIAVAGELNLPWEKLFSTFEAEAERPVAILTLEPDAGKRELVLTAEARNFEAMLAYYRMLKQKENLSAVVLHAHQVNQKDSEKPIRFRITAKWAVNS
ncbi:hypothetical protein [Propionivibrio sp.]|uniref:hypothetical protein n=1 Tax=Propionivibrio sp. TaxID=2212460 RepID=UPI003BF0D8C4